MILNTFQKYMLIKKMTGTQYIVNILNIHPFTAKRWELLESVPKQYDSDLQKIIEKIHSHNKYIDIVKFRKEKSHDFDQFYTTKKLARRCFQTLNRQLLKLNISQKEYIFIEPSAGVGNIYDLLPKERRIGIEIDPINNNCEYIISDYLEYKPIKSNKKYIVFGNPPFGLRGNMALRFINHSSSFADVVAFILPPMFNSDGKGTPKNRVKGFKLFYSENLLLQTFEYPDGTEVKLSVCFQIWTKVGLNLLPAKTEVKSAKNYIKIYSLSDGEKSKDKRNVNMIDNCDLYLPSTCFGAIEIKTKFDDLPYKRGYGIKILKEKSRIYDLLLNFDWDSQAMISVNSSKNFRKSLIEDALIQNNIFDII